MDMTVISLLGIFLGVALFIFCAFKGFNLTLAALLSSLVMVTFSGNPILQGITETWAGGVSGSFGRFMFMFILGTLYGKLAEAGGSSKKIATSLVKILRKNKKNERFFGAYFIPIFYFILTYAGVTGFVIIFTVLAIGRELFEELNIPWRMWCYAIGGIIMATVLGGSLAVSNVASMGITQSDSPAAAMGLSIVMVIVFGVVHAYMLNADLKKAAEKGENFIDSGSEIVKVKMSTQLSEEELPHFIPAVIPMVTMILMCSAFKINVTVALTTGNLLCLILFWKNLKKQSLKALIEVGVVSSFPPLINVCAASAVGTVIMSVPGFTLIRNALDMFPPMISGVGLGVLASMIVASSTSTVPAFGPLMFENFQAAGLSAATSHRLMVLATNVASIPPHNAAVVNASSLNKIAYKQAAWIYGKASFVPGFVSLIVAVILIQLGIF